MRSKGELKIVYVNFIRNKFKFGENGGLTNDFDYEDTTQTDRQILAINLNHATNTVKNNHGVRREFTKHRKITTKIT